MQYFKCRRDRYYDFLWILIPHALLQIYSILFKHILKRIWSTLPPTIDIFNMLSESHSILSDHFIPRQFRLFSVPPTNKIKNPKLV